MTPVLFFNRYGGNPGKIEIVLRPSDKKGFSLVNIIQSAKVSIAAVYNVKAIWLKGYIIQDIYFVNRDAGKHLTNFRNGGF